MHANRPAKPRPSDRMPHSPFSLPQSHLIIARSRYANAAFTPSYADGPCEVNAVGTQLFSLPLAWPIRNEFAPTINYYILEQINRGEWQKLRDFYMPAQQCGNYRLTSASLQSGALDKVTPVMFSGPILLVIFGVCAAMTVRGGAIMIKRRKAKARKVESQNAKVELDVARMASQDEVCSYEVCSS